jgi:hypothetical protein
MEWAAYLRHGRKRASRARGEVVLHHVRPVPKEIRKEVKGLGGAKERSSRGRHGDAV